LWYNGTTLRYLRTLGIAAAIGAIATPAALSSDSTAPTKIPIGTTGGILISAFGSAWTTDLTLNRLIRIDPQAERVSGKHGLGARPYGLAAGAGSIWVASQAADTVARVNPQTLKVTKRIRVGFQAFAAAFGAGSVWVSLEADGSVVRINPRKNKVVARIRGLSDPNGLVYAYHAVWISDLARGRVVRVNPRTNRVTDRIRLPKADWITTGAGSLWVSSERNRVYRLDPRTRRVTASVAVDANPLASAWVDGRLWVPNIDSNTISVVDPATNAVSRTIPAGNAPLGVLSTPDGVFVSMSNDGAVWRFDAIG
jgi:YVTN family beta-propeller protein